MLSDLQARNETLFYTVLMSDPATYMPIVYTPTVGEACQKFGHIFRQARGMYLPITARGRLKELLLNWPEKDVRFIVVTDGERILGLGDLGAGGMGIPIGKLALCTACAGRAAATLPAGRARRRHEQSGPARRPALSRTAPAPCRAATNTCPSSMSSSRPCRSSSRNAASSGKTFANFNAVPILARYRDKVCTFNDDIQGTAGVALAGILAPCGSPGRNSPTSGSCFSAPARRRPASPN